VVVLFFKNQIYSYGLIRVILNIGSLILILFEKKKRGEEKILYSRLENRLILCSSMNASFLVDRYDMI
jgi:hypothetical protein